MEFRSDGKFVKTRILAPFGTVRAKTPSAEDSDCLTQSTSGCEPQLARRSPDRDCCTRN